MQRLALQSLLIDSCKAGRFYAVLYEDAKPVVVNEDTASVVAPISCRANEVGSSFGADTGNGLRVAAKRVGWRFEVRLDWAVEVTLERFERDITTNPPRLPGASGYPPITLVLSKVDVSHPVQGMPSTGTKATLAFECIIGRI